MAGRLDLHPRNRVEATRVRTGTHLGQRRALRALANGVGLPQGLWQLARRKRPRAVGAVPSTFAPRSTTTVSPARSSRSPGWWCGRAALGPEATIGVKETSSAPSSWIAGTIHHATSASVLPTTLSSASLARTRSTTCAARRIASSSPGSLTARSTSGTAVTRSRRITSSWNKRTGPSYSTAGSRPAAAVGGEGPPPHIAAWLAANEKPLAVAVEASKRPEYYNPLVAKKPEKGPSSLIGVLLPNVQKCREIANALTCRAMLRIQEGKLAEAWQDLLAVHRLGRLIARGGTLIETLVGIAINAVATTAEIVYLDKAKLTSAQVRECLKDLQSLPPLPPMADKMDLGERFMYLDSLQMLRSSQIARAGTRRPRSSNSNNSRTSTGPPASAPATSGTTASARPCTQDSPRTSESTRRDRRGTQEPQEGRRQLPQSGPAARRQGDREDGRQSHHRRPHRPPDARRPQGARRRGPLAEFQNNLHVAFALAAYKLDEGRYPAKLDDLKPKYLAAIPGDVFSGKALIYKPDDKGFLLYSVGLNGKDDGGRWNDDDPSGDDPRATAAAGGEEGEVTFKLHPGEPHASLRHARPAARCTRCHADCRPQRRAEVAPRQGHDVRRRPARR